jgi:glycosyltransferase involved in cell wall biosynthesis
MHAKLKDTSNRLVLISPGYNVEHELDKCLHSIIIQGYTNWILILINDMSTDNTLEVMKEWAKTDERIYVVNNKVKKYQVRNWFDTIHNYCKPSDQEFFHYAEIDDKLVEQPFQYQVEPNDIIVFFDPDDWWGIPYAFELIIKEYLYREILCLTARNYCMNDMYNHDAAIYTSRQQLLSTSDHQFSLCTYRAALFKWIPLDHFLYPDTKKFYEVCGDYCITAPLLYMCGPEYHHHLFVDNFIVYNNIRPECDDSTFEKSQHQTEVRKLMFNSFKHLVEDNALPIYR